MPLPRRRQSVLAGQVGGRFLPLMLGVIAWLACLALAAALLLASLGAGWNAGLEGAATVEIPASAASRAEAARQRLSAAPGVTHARLLSPAETRRLVEPWLGSAALDALPLPALIDLELGPDADRAALGKLVEAMAPGARLDDHAQWAREVRELARAAELTAAALFAVTILAAIAAIAFAVRAQLAVERRAVELLHLMGAGDPYIAWQFQLQAAALTLRGALAGTALALLTLLALGAAAADLDSQLVPQLRLGALSWGAIAAMPLAAAALALVAARVTVLRALARLP